MRLLALRAEKMQDFHHLFIGRPEPMGFGSVELRDFTGVEDNLVRSQDETQIPGEDIEPFVAGVGDQLRWARTDHLLEDLHAAGIARQRNDGTAVPASARGEVNPGIACSGSTDELVQRDPVRSGKRQQHIEGGTTLPRFEA